MKPFIKNVIALTMATVFILCCSVFVMAADERGYIVVTDTVEANSGKDVSAEIQAIIDSNPNRTIYFPDGEYLHSKPLYTPAEPTKSVSLELSDYAVLKAAGEWNNRQYRNTR